MKQGIESFKENVSNKKRKSVVPSYFKISNVSIETEEAMKSRMDERHAVMAGLLASKLLQDPVAINLRLLAQTY